MAMTTIPRTVMIVRTMKTMVFAVVVVN